MLEKLYYQYRSGKKPRFASRLYNWLGRTFIGTPEELGAKNLRPDHDAHFHLVKVDRLAPEDKEDFEVWSKSAVQPNIMRTSMLPEVARGTFYCAVALVCAMCVIVWFFNLGAAGVNKLTNGSSDTGDQETSGPAPRMTLEKCNDLAQLLQSGEVSRDMVPMATVKACQQLTQEDER